MDIQLGMSIRLKNLLKFVLPSMILMVFLSLYTMIDGIFVAQFVGTDALSAINIIYPIINVVLAIGLMLGTGGSAICARKLGMGKTDEAKQDFSSICLLALFLGLLLLVLGLLFQTQLVYLLGSNETLFSHCLDYLIPTVIFAPALMMQSTFQVFLITAGKPNAAFALTLTGGLTNILFDFIFVALLDLGTLGAAWATGLGCLFAALYGLCSFIFSKNSLLHFMKPIFRPSMLLQCCANGSSEMVTNLSLAVTTYLFNTTMLRLAGEDGVAAITIILYSQFLLSALYMGYASGVAPLISYNYGRQDRAKLHRLYRFSICFTLFLGIFCFALALLLSQPITNIFSDPESAVNTLATEGLRIFALSFLAAGVNIFASSMFTAFSNGPISALISLLRTFVFLVSLLLLLPQLLGVSGVFLAVPIAELLSLLVCIFLFLRYRSVYHYAGGT